MKNLKMVCEATFSTLLQMQLDVGSEPTLWWFKLNGSIVCLEVNFMAALKSQVIHRWQHATEAQPYTQTDRQTDRQTDSDA